MTTTAIASMIIEDVDLRTRPGLSILVDPMTCKHRWEPHLLEVGKAYCPRCGSLARWVNDDRTEESL